MVSGRWVVVRCVVVSKVVATKDLGLARRRCVREPRAAHLGRVGVLGVRLGLGSA